MDGQDKQAPLHYGTHTSALKDAEFIHADLDEQVWAGHVNVLPLDMITALTNLWHYLLEVMPQVGQIPCLIFYFTWSGINESTKRLSPMEAMRFGSALCRILQQVLSANPRLGPV